MLSPQFDIYRNIAPLTKDKTVLDVGCGTGFGALQLLPYAESVWGVDVDTEAIAFCKETIPNVTFAAVDISRATYLPRFDVILMVEVLEHIPDCKSALENVKRFLNPDGMFLMTARNANADLRKNELHERELSAGQLEEMLSKFFKCVRLYDYKMQEVNRETHLTPLVATGTNNV